MHYPIHFCTLKCLTIFKQERQFATRAEFEALVADVNDDICAAFAQTEDVNCDLQALEERVRGVVGDNAACPYFKGDVVGYIPPFPYFNVEDGSDVSTDEEDDKTGKEEGQPAEEEGQPAEEDDEATDEEDHAEEDDRDDGFEDDQWWKLLTNLLSFWCVRCH